MHNRFHTNAGYDQRRLNVEATQKYITEGGQMDVSRVKKIDRKLKKCLNPEFIPGTEEYPPSAFAFVFSPPPLSVFVFRLSRARRRSFYADAVQSLMLVTMMIVMMVRYAKRREREQAERAARRQEKLRRQAEGQIDAEGTYSSRRSLMHEWSVMNDDVVGLQRFWRGQAMAMTTSPRTRPSSFIRTRNDSVAQVCVVWPCAVV